MDKAILQRLEALEKANASREDIAYIREVLRRVRAAAVAYTGDGNIVTVELPERVDFHE